VTPQAGGHVGELAGEDRFAFRPLKSVAETALAMRRQMLGDAATVTGQPGRVDHPAIATSDIWPLLRTFSFATQASEFVKHANGAMLALTDVRWSEHDYLATEGFASSGGMSHSNWQLRQVMWRCSSCFGEYRLGQPGCQWSLW
jgi:hypothetical protein